MLINFKDISYLYRKDILENITIKHRLDKNTYIPPKPSFFNFFYSFLLFHTFSINILHIKV
jgi:hypothetical protein